MDGAGSGLRVTRDGGVMVLSIDAPPWNRMGLAAIDAMEAAVEEAAADASVRALLFSAEGEANFSVGMDLRQLLRAERNVDAVLDQRRRLLARIEGLDKPSVATLFGHCLGGGLELPLACHIRLGAEQGLQAGLPELDLGTVPAWGGTARLARCIGRDRALEMILQARRIDAAEALRLGLVSALHPLHELKAAGLQLARRLAERPPIAVAGVLRCLVGAEHAASLDDRLDAEREAFRRCAASADQREGLRAFFDKRRPVFRGV